MAKRWPDEQASRLRELGLDAPRAWKSSVNGRGPLWNAGAQHRVAALPPKHFTDIGLVRLGDQDAVLQRFNKEVQDA